MKKIFLLVFLFHGLISLAQANIATQESLPIFPGCEEEAPSDLMKCFQIKLKDHIKENYKYPEQASREKLKGRAIVEYAIETDGFVKVTKVEGEHPILNDEAKRIIELLPKMQPGYQNGKPVRMLMSIPISF